MVEAEEVSQPLFPDEGIALKWNDVPIDKFFYDGDAMAVDLREMDGEVVGPAVPIAFLAYKTWLALLILVPIIAYFFASAADGATEPSTTSRHMTTESSPTHAAIHAAEPHGTNDTDTSMDSENHLLQVPRLVVVSIYLVVSAILLIMEHKIRRFSIIPHVVVLKQLQLPVPLPCRPKFYVWLGYVTCMSIMSYMDLLNKGLCVGVVLKSTTYGLWVKLCFFVGYVVVFAQWFFAYCFSMPKSPDIASYTLCPEDDYTTWLVETQDNGRALQGLARTNRMVSVYDAHHEYACSPEIASLEAPHHHFLEELRQANWWFIIFFFHRCVWLGLQSFTLIGADCSKDGQNIFFLGMTVLLSLKDMASALKTSFRYWGEVEIAIRNISGSDELTPMTLTHAQAQAAGGPREILDKFGKYCAEKLGNDHFCVDGGRHRITTTTKTGPYYIGDISEFKPEDYPIEIEYQEDETLPWRRYQLKKCRLTLKVSLFVEVLFVITAFLVVLRALTKRHESEILNSMTFKRFQVLGKVLCGLVIVGMVLTLRAFMEAHCRTRPRSSE